MHSSDNIFFIIGRGRSGTDLLQRLLNTHPDVCVPPETTVPALLYYKYSTKKWNEKLIKSFVKDVFRDQKISKWWNLRSSKFKSYLLSKHPLNYRSALLHLYKYYSSTLQKSGSLLGDKNPSNSLYTDEIIKTFPDAKFVVMVRNPLDNVYSFQNVSFDFNNIKDLANRWNFYNKEILNASRNYPDKFLFVRFEDLIEDTSSIVVKISEFIGVSNSFDVNKIEAGNQSWQQNLGGEITTKHINKGVNNLRDRDKEYIKQICGETAQQLGYDFEITTKGPFHMKSWFFNRLEKHFIRLPLYLSSSMLQFYRKKKKIIVEN